MLFVGAKAPITLFPDEIEDTIRVYHTKFSVIRQPEIGGFLVII